VFSAFFRNIRLLSLKHGACLQQEVIRRSLDSPKGPLSLPESDVTCHGAVYFLMSYRVGAAVEKVGQVRGSGLTNVEVAPQCNLFYGRLGNCYDGCLGCTWAVENK
jgi:hypothetical protein